MRAALLGDDDYPDVFIPNDSENQIGKEQAAQATSLLGPGHEHLRNLIAAGEVNDGRRRITAFQDPAFDMKIASRPQAAVRGCHPQGQPHGSAKRPVETSGRRFVEVIDTKHYDPAFQAKNSEKRTCDPRSLSVT